MKTRHKQSILATALVCLCVLVSSTAPAQNISAHNGHLTLAPADANSSSGGDFSHSGSTSFGRGGWSHSDSSSNLLPRVLNSVAAIGK